MSSFLVQDLVENPTCDVVVMHFGFLQLILVFQSFRYGPNSLEDQWPLVLQSVCYMEIN
jgi:hypothetical protein